MKKIGEYTVRGQASEDDSEAAPFGIKIPLFDGRFDTGYRVVDFRIWGATWSNSSNPDVVGKLGTEENLVSSSVNFMNAGDNREIAWAGHNGGLDVGGTGFSIVDPDNMIIEDLYVYTRAVTDTVPVNYMVKLEKYDITDWQGALGMVRNRSQS